MITDVTINIPSIPLPIYTRVSESELKFILILISPVTKVI